MIRKLLLFQRLINGAVFINVDALSAAGAALVETPWDIPTMVKKLL